MAIQLMGVDNNIDASQQLNELSNNALTNSLQNNAQSLSKAQQILDTGNAAIAQNAVSIGQRRQSESQTDSGIAGLLGGVAKVVGTVYEQNANAQIRQAEIDAKTQAITQKKAQAEAEAKAEAEYNSAIVQVNDLNNQWLAADKFRSDPGGMTTFRDEGLKLIMGLSNITESQRKDLIDRHYENYNREMKAFSDRTAEYTEKVSQARRETVVKQNTFKVNAVVAGLTWDSDPTDALKKVDEMVNSTLNDKNLPLLDRLMATNAMLETAYSKVSNNTAARAEVESKLKRLQDYQAEAVKNWNSNIPFSERKAIDEQLQAKHGLNIDTTYMAYEEANKRALEYQQQVQTLQNAQKAGLIDAAQAVNLSDEQIGATIQVLLFGEGNTAALRERFTNTNYPEANTAGASEIRRLLTAVPQMRKDVENLLSDNATLRQAQANLNKDAFTFLATADVRTRSLIESFASQFLVKLPPSSAGLTDAQKEEYIRQTEQLQRAIADRIRLNDQRAQSITAELNKYKLNEPEAVLRKNAPARKAIVDKLMSDLSTQIEQTRQRQQQQNLGIISPTTGRGEARNPDLVSFVAPDGVRRLRPPAEVSLATVNFSGRSAHGVSGKIMLPFRPEDVNKISVNNDNFLEQRPKHIHAGEDIAAPAGTRIINYVGGDVVKVSRDIRNGRGYGRYITVRGDDGMYHRFAHMSSTNVREGQRIEAGDILGFVGDDGSPGSYHLHWEVRTNNGYGTTGTVNPLKYMGGLNFKESSVPPPRGNDAGWEYNTNNPNQSRVPNNAVKLPNGRFIINNNVGKLGSSNATPAQQTYTVGRPVRTGSVVSKPFTGKNIDSDNHGYAYIANNDGFRRKLADVSNRLGIDAKWLADIMAFETGNFTKANNWSHPRTGVVGLIGFTPATAKALGTSTYELSRMPPEQQLDYVYKYLSDPQLKPHIGKGVEYLAASIFGGSPLMRRLTSNRGRAMGIGDGDINLNNYLKRLGRDVGRRYEVRSSRSDRLLAATHTGYHSGCSVCEALRASGSDIIPHESDYA